MSGGSSRSSSPTPSASWRSAPRPTQHLRSADLGPVKLLARTLQDVAPKDLRGLVDDAKRQLGSGVVAIIGVSEEGKAGLVVGVTDDLTDTYNAVDLGPSRRGSARRQRRGRTP